LLFEDKQRLVELWVALANFLAKNCDLGVLATETQDCRSGNIRMMNLPCNQAAEIVRILARPSAAAFVK